MDHKQHRHGVKTAHSDLAFTLVEGDLVVDHGLTLSLDIGGTIPAAPDPDEGGGYAVYQFAGTQP